MSETRASGANRCGVLLLTELFPPDQGGSAVLLGNIYTRLHPPVTVIRHSADGTTREIDGTLRLVEVPMTGGHWGVTSLTSLQRYRRLVTRLRFEHRRHPSIVHCGRALPEGLAALAAAAVGGTSRYVCWTHGEELQYAKSSRELTFLLGKVHRRASALIANSHNTASELRRLGIANERIHVVHPGVDVERFAASRRGAAVRARYAPDGALLLMTVGRLQRRKGHDHAIETLAAMVQDLPPFRYVIVGDGEERERLERLAVERGLAERVVFAGSATSEELPDYYAAADIFLHPNRIDDGDVEGFGIVFLEAAAAGVPTIGGGTGGVPEAVEHGSTGLLVSGTDQSELAAAIRTLASSLHLRRQFGDAGRARVRTQFTWERAAALVADLHREVAAA